MHVAQPVPLPGVRQVEALAVVVQADLHLIALQPEVQAHLFCLAVFEAIVHGLFEDEHEVALPFHLQPDLTLLFADTGSGKLNSGILVQFVAKVFQQYGQLEKVILARVHRPDEIAHRVVQFGRVRADLAEVIPHLLVERGLQTKDRFGEQRYFGEPVPEFVVKIGGSFFAHQVDLADAPFADLPAQAIQAGNHCRHTSGDEQVEPEGVPEGGIYIEFEFGYGWLPSAFEIAGPHLKAIGAPRQVRVADRALLSAVHPIGIEADQAVGVLYLAAVGIARRQETEFDEILPVLQLQGRLIAF